MEGHHVREWFAIKKIILNLKQISNYILNFSL